MKKIVEDRPPQEDGPLAQLAEQGTLNAKVGGSIPSRPTARTGF